MSVFKLSNPSPRPAQQLGRTRILHAISSVGVLLGVACDADPTILGDNASANVTLPVHDNPSIVGSQDVTGQTWRYSDPSPLDGARPESSRQTVWADAHTGGSVGQLLEFEADRPIFSGKMEQAGWAYPLPAGGSSQTFVPSLSTSSVAWQYLPAECSQLTDPACSKYWSRPAPNQDKPYTFPFVLGNVNLEPNTPVTIVAESRKPHLVAGSTWSSTVSILNTATIQLDPNITLVPVHVHVFTDRDGNLNNSFMGGMANSDAGRLKMANLIRGVFDDYSVEIERIGSSASGLDWHKEYTTHMTRNIIASGDPPPVPTVYDELIQNCQIQTRLWAVDFIRQDDGLEKAMIGFGNARQTTPWWDASDPAIQSASATMGKYINAMNWNPGVHVFIVGSINTGDFTSFETAGIAFTQSGTRPGYALLAGTSRDNSSASLGKQTLMHEVGHVLGLRHDAHENGAIIDDIGLMQANKLTAGSGSCARMRAQGPKLLQPANTL